MAGRPFNGRTLQPPTPHIAATDYAGNFGDFLAAVPHDTPWCFWYGSVEPHRAYEYGSGVAKGHKSLSDIDRVPGFWPDNETVRNDLLDYAFELEYFDSHLARMLQQLEQRGELDNTLVVVTSDNGMPFPRVKGQEYELSNHLPLAIMWKDGIHDPWSDHRRLCEFHRPGTDLRRTGRLGLAADRHGTRHRPEPDRHLLLRPRGPGGAVARSRPDRQGTPRRRASARPGISDSRHRQEWPAVPPQLRNVTRWPAGNPETGYLNCDGSPTKTQILDLRRAGTDVQFWKLAFGKRVAEELYNVEQDPECLTNLAADPQYAARMTQLRTQLFQELHDQADPRMLGQGHVFDEYPYANPAQQGLLRAVHARRKTVCRLGDRNRFRATATRRSRAPVTPQGSEMW